nr:uncharacterized protein LOC115266121 [Aedes albopictus]
MTMFDKTAENFHIFHRSPSKFCIVPGHWKLLWELPGKLPESKKLFVKLQNKVIEPTPVLADQFALGQAQRPATTPSKLATIHECTEHTTKHTTESAVIRTKISSWLEGKGMEVPAEITVTVLGARRATVDCFYCAKPVALSSRENKNGSWGWIISNYTQHLQQHASSKRNTLENYFYRASSTGEAGVEIPGETVVPAAMDSPSTGVSDRKAGLKSDSPAVPSISATIEEQVEEYVVYEELDEEMLESNENRSLDYEEDLKDTPANPDELEHDTGTQDGNISASSARSQQLTIAKKQTILKIEYV